DLVVHERLQALLELLAAVGQLEVHAAPRGPGTWRNSNGPALPGWTNQHSPAMSPSNSCTTTAATSSAFMTVNPASSNAGRIGSVSADSAKPGQTALMRTPSAASTGPSARTSPTSPC